MPTCLSKLFAFHAPLTHRLLSTVEDGAGIKLSRVIKIRDPADSHVGVQVTVGPAGPGRRPAAAAGAGAGASTRHGPPPLNDA